MGTGSPKQIFRQVKRLGNSPSARRVLWLVAFLAQLLLALYLGDRLSSVLMGTGIYIFIYLWYIYPTLGNSAHKSTNDYCLNARENNILQAGNVLGGNYTTNPCAYEYNFNKVPHPHCFHMLIGFYRPSISGLMESAGILQVQSLKPLTTQILSSMGNMCHLLC